MSDLEARSTESADARGRMAERVRRAYVRFDLLHPRKDPLDDGDTQNLHEWMREVTAWIEAQS